MATWSWTDRALIGVRAAAIGAAAVAVAGSVGAMADWPALTSTLGPTAYVFAAHPASATARLRNAVTGHLVALAAGLGSSALFGLWWRGSGASGHGPSWRQIGSAGLALAATLLVLELCDAHHAPAAATTLLVATGLAGPTRPLLGLILGLIVVLVLGPAATRLPYGRSLAARRASTAPDL